MKLNRKLLFLICLVFVIFTGTAYASSSIFLTQAEKFINRNCSKKNLTNETALLCYLFNKSQEQDASITSLKTTLSPVPSEIKDLQNRIASLEALISPTPTAKTYVVSDATWKFSLTAPTGWLTPTFDDTSWINTQAPSDGQCSASAIIPSSLINENGTLPMSVSNPNWTSETGYFRKTFDLSFIPSSASLKELIDDNGSIYINGNVIFSTTLSPNAGIQSATINPNVFVKGTNVINVVDVDLGGCQGAQVEVITTH